MKKNIAIGVLCLLIGIQFSQPNIEVDLSVPENDFITTEAPPKEISNIIDNACYDCHSYKTNFPWYSFIAPVSWWVNSHVDEGREHLNFSEWNSYNAKQKAHKIEECIELTENEEMPLKPYMATHKEAQLTVAQRSSLADWFKSLE